MISGIFSYVLRYVCEKLHKCIRTSCISCAQVCNSFSFKFVFVGAPIAVIICPKSFGVIDQLFYVIKSRTVYYALPIG